MCRITGILPGHIQDLELDTLIKGMRDSMEHGGPDSDGLFIPENKSLAFGHRRLSLLDLSPMGHQPMTDTEEKCWIIFNGEIYNFKELRSELKSKGHQFKSNSDTEVILAAYKEWGTGCFARFNGMFAFALYDMATNQVFLVRDAAGIKPLYYYSGKNDELIFASEIKAFLKYDPHWAESRDWKLLLLSFGHIPEPYTTLEGVVVLEKGNYLQYDLTSKKILKIDRYRSLGFKKISIRTKEAAIAALKEQLQKAVDRHLISDAPIGLFLSGGIDSSLLTLLAAKQLKDQLHTLSVTFTEQGFSEQEYQQAIIKLVNCKHKNYTVGKADLETNLNAIIQAYDQPSNDGINSWFISKCAHENGLKAVLSGLGSDELFGGYPSFSRIKILYRLRKLPDFIFKLSRLLPSVPLQRIAWMQIKGNPGLYLTLRGLCTPTEAARLTGLTETEIIARISALRFSPTLEAIAGQDEAASWLEFNYYMQNQLLKDSDYMSMQHALELRVPFLDQDFVDTVYSIDPDLLYNHRGLPKQLLIDAFKDILPEEIWNRKKMGFSFPFQKWFGEIDSLKQAVIQTQPGIELWKKFELGKIHWSKVWAYYLTLSFHKS